MKRSIFYSIVFILFFAGLINVQGQMSSGDVGKTETVKCLTGVSTLKRSDEIKNRQTVNLGYANAKIFKCQSCHNIYVYMFRK